MDTWVCQPFICKVSHQNALFNMFNKEGFLSWPWIRVSGDVNDTGFVNLSTYLVVEPGLWLATLTALPLSLRICFHVPITKSSMRSSVKSKLELSEKQRDESVINVLCQLGTKCIVGLTMSDRLLTFIRLTNMSVTRVSEQIKDCYCLT